MQEQNTAACSTCVFFAKLCCTVLFEHWGRHKMAGLRPACSGTKRCPGRRPAACPGPKRQADGRLPAPAQSGRLKACLPRHKAAGRRPACSGTTWQAEGLLRPEAGTRPAPAQGPPEQGKICFPHCHGTKTY